MAGGRKDRIPPSVREEVWRQYGGAVCWCCQTEAISAQNKHLGHMVAEAKGGLPTVDNLRPVCQGCNLRMGTQNMYDFMLAEGFPLRDVAAVYRVFAKDPDLAKALKGRHVYAVPSLSACHRPEYDYVLAGTLCEKHPFLRPLEEKGRLADLFEASDCEGITFHCVVRPDYARWVRYKQEASWAAAVERELGLI